ncbi:MAG: hypothetical protein K0Q79_983 [Flavipsychrobacter sp.]|jgi:hypothetical protein|nr:hypothetical protein [Flavipsychrobacter sp.]
MATTCPYCISEINEKATVCKYCQRDVALVLSLMKEIDALKHKVPASAPAETALPLPGQQKNVQFSFSFLLFVYVALIIAILSIIFMLWPDSLNTSFLPKNIHIYAFQIVAVPVNLIVTWYIIKLSKNPNLLILLVYTLAPYALMYIIYHELLFDNYASRYFISSLIQLSMINIALSAAAGVASYLRYTRGPLVELLSPTAFIKYWVNWSKHGQNLQEYLQKIAALVAAIGTLITFILSIYDKL